MPLLPLSKYSQHLPLQIPFPSLSSAYQMEKQHKLNHGDPISDEEKDKPTTMETNSETPPYQTISLSDDSSDPTDDDHPVASHNPTPISVILEKSKSDIEYQIIQPHSQLPKPKPPPGIDSLHRSKSDIVSDAVSDTVDTPSSIGRFFHNAILKRFPSMKDSRHDSEVTQFNISGVKVVVKLKDDGIKGRITFFSRSNCRDCTAVRSLLREKGLKFVEINIDVYRKREKELVERTGTAQVPQIFFNEKYFGGLIALNSLRNSDRFDQKTKEMLKEKCPDGAPAPPVYGFDDDEDEEDKDDEMISIVKILRQRLPIQDRLMKMKIVRNCFSGSETVDVLVNHLNCEREKAVAIGKKLARKHFIRHVFGENEFEDGNHYYRFLEHEAFVPKCYNIRGSISINDSEPKAAATVGERLNKIMSAILESYSSDDRRHIDYLAITKSEEFRRYLNLTQDLQRLNLLDLSSDEKLSFFLNLYNAMVIHAVIRIGRPGGEIDSRSFFSTSQYIVGGCSYSPSSIKNGILRNNRRPTYGLIKPFGTGDKQLQLCMNKINPLIHFGLCDGTKSSPTVRFFTPQGVEAELRRSAREFFERGGIEINLVNRTVYLTRIIKWFSVDFGTDKEILKWILNYLDPNKSGLLTHLLGDENPINIVYQDYDWAVNS